MIKVSADKIVIPATHKSRSDVLGAERKRSEPRVMAPVARRNNEEGMVNNNMGELNMKNFIKILTSFLTALSMITLSLCTALAYDTPDEITVSTCENKGTVSYMTDTSMTDENSIISFSSYTVVCSEVTASEDNSDQLYTKGSLKLFGVLPIKDVNVRYTDRPIVTLGGQPFGIRLYTGGLVVSKISGVPTAQGIKKPAAAAGIVCGDTITHAGNVQLKTNEQLIDICDQSGGNPVLLRCIHDGTPYTASVTPVLDSELGQYRLGMWVRDSCAGIGTVTFTHDATKTFAGLGHGLYDSQSGSLMPLYKGDIVAADILSADKSAGGSPGSLCGVFTGSDAIGSITSNSECGIYGIYNDVSEGDKAEIAFRQEVTKGKARILSTIEGCTPRYYDIEIEEISYNSSDPSKNMVIRVTDKTLLEKTGGIVRGMSGSPVIQNGRLVGAVTHVFVNDPSKGYAVFAETMAEHNSDIVQKMAG